VFRFFDHFTTQLGNTINYSAIANILTLQITAANTKSSPSCSVFTSRFLVTALREEIFQIQTLKSHLQRLPYRTASQLTLFLTYNIPSRSTRKLPVASVECVSVAAETYLPSHYPETSLVYSSISWSLHRSRSTRYNT
jgi:hypothetical protein